MRRKISKSVKCQGFLEVLQLNGRGDLLRRIISRSNKRKLKRPTSLFQREKMRCAVANPQEKAREETGEKRPGPKAVTMTAF